jgi:4-amino-4-deoxy-L-arabinose transferase-like glycosyltransferase
MSRARDRRGPAAPQPATPRRRLRLPRLRAPAFLTALGAAEPWSPAWAEPAARVVLALFAAAALAMVHGPHTVGDVFTETDFYGAYAEGAGLWQRLAVDPSRYGVVGPVFELVLGLVGFVVRDLFLAAQWISVLAMTVALACWHRVLVRSLGPVAALCALALLATNAQVYRHAWAATTDALAFGLAAASFAALTGALPRAGARTAGVLAALAFLTRYTSVVLLPTGVLALALGWTGLHRGQRAAAVRGFLLGFVATAAPWLAFSFGSGQRFQFQFHHNLAYEVFAKWRDIPWDTYQREIQPRFPDLASVIRENPAAVFGRLFINLREHLWFDARDLVGGAVGATAVLGTVLLFADRAASRLRPLALYALLLYLALVPVFHSPRYSMALLPLWVALAGHAFGSRRLAAPWGRGGAWLKPLLVVVPLAFALRDTTAATARTLEQLPREARRLADQVRPLLRPGDRVLARKAHFAFHAGITPLAFPFTDSLRTLGDYTRAQGVRWLYFSWPELELRPVFAFLLDTTARVPGLTLRAASDDHPAVLYEIGPEFGTEPEWYLDPTRKGVHDARATAQVRHDDVRSRLILALWEREQGRPEEAQPWLDEALELAATDDGVRMLAADNLLRSGRPQQAEAQFRTLLVKRGDDPRVQSGLALALHLQQRHGEAAALWRPVLGITEDPATLAAMATSFAAVGDAATAEAARTRLRVLQAGGTP